MTSVRRAAKRAVERLSRYPGLTRSNISVEYADAEPHYPHEREACIGFYFDNLADGSRPNVPTLDEWRRSTIYIQDGKIKECTFHLPMMEEPFGEKHVEDEIKTACVSPLYGYARRQNGDEKEVLISTY